MLSLHDARPICRYEAVHAIKGWYDLRGRIDSADRCCFAFFHPALSDDPLIFVEVALTSGLPDALEPLIKLDRSEEHTSELQSLITISYAVFCLNKTKKHHTDRNKKRLHE